MKKVMIIHGYRASPLDHWFPWLHDKVYAVDGIEMDVLRMPNPEAP